MVLIVDDDLDTLEIYQIIAAKSARSHQFKVFSSPIAALQWLKNRVLTGDLFPRYILIALNMVELHGFEFIDEFERNLPYQQLSTEIIVLSNSILYQDQFQSRRYNSVAKFISKPLSKDQFCSLLEAASDTNTINT